MPKLAEDFIHTTEIKKSKFITYLHRTDSETEAKEFLKQIKKEHPNANHHCSAMIVGNILRSNDDGEPSGTAGHPMLECLMQREMQDVLAIVVRYFGGIKLGAGGLVRAYRGCVLDALDHAPLTRVEKLGQYEVSFPYEWIGKVDSLLYARHIETTLKNYEENVQYQYTTSLDLTDAFLELSNGTFTCQYIQEVEVEVPIQQKEGDEWNS